MYLKMRPRSMYLKMKPFYFSHRSRRNYASCHAAQDLRGIQNMSCRCLVNEIMFYPFSELGTKWHPLNIHRTENRVESDSYGLFFGCSSGRLPINKQTHALRLRDIYRSSDIFGWNTHYLSVKNTHSHNNGIVHLKVVFDCIHTAEPGLYMYAVRVFSQISTSPAP